MKKRVVITGVSCITPIGNNMQDYWENSIKGKSGLRIIHEVGGLEIPEHMSKIVGSIDDFVSDGKYDRSVQFAVVAAKRALLDSGYQIKETDKVNVHLSTAIGNIQTMEKVVKEWVFKYGGLNDTEEQLPNTLKYDFQFNNISDIVAELLGANGEISVLATGCTGGVDAMGYSFEQIRRGNADVVITGSSESPITPSVVSSFSKIGATSTNNKNPQKASCPFDISRDGFVLAEGCGIFILESLEHAIKRNANIMAEIVGYGSCSNALHMTDIPSDGQSICKSMQMALDDAEISGDKIDYVNLHGSSTPQNDFAERNALKVLLGEKYKSVPVTSNKSQIGHALSASNSIEMVSTIKTLQTGIVPPTNNLENKDPDCDLNVQNFSRTFDKIDYVLKNSSGFSGIHSSIVLKKY